MHLPEAGAVPAKVVWSREPFYGCEFAQPVARAAVSAALLKSPLEEPPVELITPREATWRTSEVIAPTTPKRSSSEAALALVLLGGAVLAFILAMVALRFT